MMLIESMGANSSEIWKYNSTQENTFENIICKMSAILSRPQCVNIRYILIFAVTVRRSDTASII